MNLEAFVVVWATFTAIVVGGGVLIFYNQVKNGKEKK